MEVFPRASKDCRENGWILEFSFTKRIADSVSVEALEAYGSCVQMEDAENIMLAAERYAEVVFARRLNRIASMCGDPDPAEACRAILAEVREAMSEGLDPGQYCQICGKTLADAPDGAKEGE